MKNKHLDFTIEPRDRGSMILSGAILGLFLVLFLLSLRDGGLGTDSRDGLDWRRAQPE